MYYSSETFLSQTSVLLCNMNLLGENVGSFLFTTTTLFHIVAKGAQSRLLFGSLPFIEGRIGKSLITDGLKR